MGVPPDCVDIPTSTSERGTQGRGKFTDAMFGDGRFFEGVDTIFILGSVAVSSDTSQSVEKKNGDMKDAAYARVSEESIRGSDPHDGHFLTRTLLPTSDSVPSFLSFASTPSSGVSIIDVSGVIRSIYITFTLNRSVFSGEFDSLSVYVSRDMRGERVTFWRGSDLTPFAANIDI
jgi:hypothetical protein